MLSSFTPKDNKQFYKLPQLSCKPSSAGSPAQLGTQPAGELETSPTHLYINKETEYNKETEEASLINLWNKNCKLGRIESISSKAKKGVTEFFKGTDIVEPGEAITLLIREVNKSDFLLSKKWFSFNWIFSLEKEDSTGEGKQFNFMKIMGGKFSDDKTKKKNLTFQNRNSQTNQNLSVSILPEM